MPAFKEYKEARSQLPLFKISFNPNQSLSAQLKEYDKKKSALKSSTEPELIIMGRLKNSLN
ncbi:hypothetical protein EC561_05640 [Helicobacter pylori]|nr:hypothetical protein EC561_05640 [Helicobacter pylori]